MPAQTNLTSFNSVAQAPTMSSREIAELVGKEHKHVMRDLRTLKEQLGELFGGVVQFWTHPQNGQAYDEFVLDKDTCLTLLLGYDAVARMKVVKRWQELESKAQPTELTRMDILKLAMESEEARIKAEAERDHAIATKAYIGSRREATAMAAASAAKNALVQLQSVLGQSVKVASVKAIEKLTKTRYEWRPLMRWCDENEVPVGKVFDEQYGQVNAYPADAWKQVHGVDLKKIFSNIIPT